ILPAQVGLLTIWAAMGPGRWHARLLLTTALASLGWFAFAAGFNAFANASSLTTSQLFRITAVVPLLFLTAQAPLWVARWTRGWRFANSTARVAADDRDARRFNMIDLLWAPLAIAAPLALVRWQLRHFDNELNGLLAIVFPCTAVLIGFSTLISTQTAFRCRTLPRGFMTVAGYSLGLGGATNAVLLAAFGIPPDFSPHRFLSMAIISTFFFMFPSLLVLRNAGYVLLPAQAKRAQG
ncbi:MAG TPA: hypothetical protein VHB99_10695, partial [Pirellulales bacterium]|nr:hypothetical protein [Pirellulales bacterium]